MRYCGNCGGSFEPVSLTEQSCPWCGAAINRTGDLEFDEVWDGAQQPTQAPTPDSAPAADSFNSFSMAPTSPAYGFGIQDPHSMTVAARKRRTFRPVVLMALVALALLLAFGSALLLNNAPGRLLQIPGIGGADVSQTTATFAAAPQDTQPSPTNSSLVGGPAPSPGVITTAGLPTPSASPNGTATPEGPPTATPAPGQPVLNVSPAKITIAVCLGSSTHVTVTNTGDGVMTWSASGSRSAYRMTPQSGSLDSGQQQTITVSGISASGSVTFAAPGADGTPQTVTITCTL